MHVAINTLARRLGAALSFISIVAVGAGQAPAEPVATISTGIPIAAEFGKKEGDLSPGEIQFIAHNVTIAAIEHFGLPGKPYAYQEDSVAANAARLKAANPSIKVLEYWGFAGSGHQNYRAYQDPTFQANKSTWYAYERPGQKKPKLDINNQAERDWWTTAAARMVQQGHIDGLYIDGAGNTVKDPLHNAKIELFRELRDKLDALHEGHKYVVINGNAENFFGSGLAPYVDGVMIEWYDLVYQGREQRPPAKNLAYLQAAYQIGRAGKQVWLKAWPYPHSATEAAWNKTTYEQKLADMRSALGFNVASYLVAATPGESFLQYSFGYAVDSMEVVTNHETDPNHWNVDPAWYSELKRDYGAPVGPMQVSGYVLTRQYPGGIARVDLANHTFSLPQPVR